MASSSASSARSSPVFQFQLDSTYLDIKASPEYKRMRPALGALMKHDSDHEGYIHATALDVACAALVAFVVAAQKRTNAASSRFACVWAIVVALMQSGKTGVMQAIWLAVCKPHFVERYLHNIVDVGGAVFITGTNDNELLNQTIERLKATHVGDELKPQSGTRVLHNASMQKLLDDWRRADREHGIEHRGEAWDIMSRRCIVVIDESHHGASDGSTIDTFLEELGIAGDGSKRRGGSHFVISISATPMSELKSNDEYKHKLCLHLQPGNNYLSPMDILAQGRVRASEKLTTPEGIKKFFAVCREAYYNNGFHQEQGCYVLVRVPTKAIHNAQFKELLDKEGFPYKEYDAEVKGKGTKDIKDLLRVKPRGIEMVLVKRRLAQGVTFSSKHVAVMYDTASSKVDTVAQSFLGRACGYHRNDPKKQRVLVYCDLKGAKEYIDWGKTSFDPRFTPGRARCMMQDQEHEADNGRRRKRGRQAAKEYQTAVPVVVPGALSAEELGLLPKAGPHAWNILRPLMQSRWINAHTTLRHLVAAPYTDNPPRVRIARDSHETAGSNSNNLNIFVQTVAASRSRQRRAPMLPSGDGEHRFEIIVDARTASATRGYVVISWRGAELAEQGPSTSVAGSGFITVGQADARGQNVPKHLKKELFASKTPASEPTPVPAPLPVCVPESEHDTDSLFGSYSDSS